MLISSSEKRWGLEAYCYHILNTSRWNLKRLKKQILDNVHTSLKGSTFFCSSFDLNGWVNLISKPNCKFYHAMFVCVCVCGWEVGGCVGLLVTFINPLYNCTQGTSNLSNILHYIHVYLQLHLGTYDSCILRRLTWPFNCLSINGIQNSNAYKVQVSAFCQGKHPLSREATIISP